MERAEVETGLEHGPTERMSALVVDRLELLEVSVSALPDDLPSVVPIDDYYSPARVRDLLRLYVYLSDSRPPRDPEMSGLVRRMFGPDGWHTEAMAKRSDIYRALVWLERRSVEMQYVIRAAYCVGLEIADIMPYVRSHLRSDATEAIVADWRDDGIEMMSAYLCGRIS